LSIYYLFLFSVIAALVFINSVRWWFIAALGISGVKWSSFAGICAAIINVAVNYVLIQRIEIEGAIYALLTSTLFLFFFSIIVIKRLKKSDIL